MKDRPNILLIAGNGRNVGKTMLACRFIESMSVANEVYGVKISSHFHDLGEEALIIKVEEHFSIVKETLVTRKDSSRMLQAGAKEVFYVQCKKEYLSKMFDYLQAYLPDDKPTVIESGGLFNIINPAIFYFIQGQGETKKVLLRNGSNKIDLSPDEAVNIETERTGFVNGSFIKL